MRLPRQVRQRVLILTRRCINIYFLYLFMFFCANVRIGGQRLYKTEPRYSVYVGFWFVNSCSSLTTNYYCYCRTVVPFLSKWFYAALYKTNGSTACDTYCYAQCVESIKSDLEMRTGLYNSMK